MDTARRVPLDCPSPRATERSRTVTARTRRPGVSRSMRSARLVLFSGPGAMPRDFCSLSANWVVCRSTCPSETARSSCGRASPPPPSSGIRSVRSSSTNRWGLVRRRRLRVAPDHRRDDARRRPVPLPPLTACVGVTLGGHSRIATVLLWGGCLAVLYRRRRRDAERRSIN